MPLAIFGVNAFASGLLILLLPETLGRELPATVREALDLSVPPAAPTYEGLSVPIVVIDEVSADETVDEDSDDDNDQIEEDIVAAEDCDDTTVLLT